MESLYRKYRPQTFDDVVGQKHVVATLRRAVLEGRTSHAYLFCGPRGTGKTTMARLLAKALLCEQGFGHLPDGTCEQCQLIAAGEHPDVYELDAASNTGVDNVREEIISRVGYAPVRGSYKVYIIDEVHMLTPAAFNALLKTLEEPPEHVVFVMCTTDPQKVLETILSRVQRFDFRPISNDELLARLEYVCQNEGFTYEREALQLVTLHARGGLRDALSDLERLATYAGGAITLDAAQDMLGEVPASTLSEIALALANRDVPALFAQVAGLVDSGRDLLQFTRELTAHLRDAYVVAAVGQRPGVVSAQGKALELLADEARAFGPADRISRAMSVLSDASSEMRTAPNQRLVLELAFTRIARPEGEVTMDALAERVAVLEARLAQLEAGEALRAPVAPAVAPAPEVAQRAVAEVPVSHPTNNTGAGQAPQTPATRAPQPRSAQPQAAQPQAAVPAPTSQTVARPAAAPATAARPVPAQAPAAAAPQPSAPARSAAVTDAGDLQRRWRQVCEELLASAPSRGSLLMNSNIESDDGNTLLVTLPKGSTFAAKMLERPDVRAIIDPLVARVFGPRHIAYAESSLKGADIARAARAAAPAAAVPRPAVRPQPTPQSQPAPQAQPMAPAQPAPRAQPDQQSQPAVPRQQASRGPQQTPPSASSYPAPWDDTPPYEAVPYTEADMTPYEEDEYYAPSSMPAPQPQQPRQAQPAAGRPQPQQAAVQPVPWPAPEAATAPAVAPAAQPAQPTTRAAAPKADPAPAASAQPAPAAAAKPAPKESTPKDPEPAASAQPAPKPRGTYGTDDASILSMLTDVFGEGVTMTREAPSAPEVPDPTSEDDDAEALALASEGYDAGDAEDEDDEFDSSIYDGEDPDDEEM